MKMDGILTHGYMAHGKLFSTSKCKSPGAPKPGKHGGQPVRLSQHANYFSSLETKRPSGQLHSMDHNEDSKQGTGETVRVCGHGAL